LGGGVNSPAPGAHPCIAPDESFIVFDSERSDDPENADLFVCFRNDDGTWSDAFDLGDDINTDTSEICAALSPDGKYLFYQSRGDIYWVSTDIIGAVREKTK
jgi:Tol biopolymer transport system component